MQTSSYGVAREQLLEACKLRERESCHYLAKTELDGTFGVKDEGAAGRHFLQARSDAWAESCSAVADMYAKGIGTPVNAEKARAFYAAACELGYQPACEVLRHPGSEVPPP